MSHERPPCRVTLWDIIGGRQGIFAHNHIIGESNSEPHRRRFAGLHKCQPLGKELPVEGLMCALLESIFRRRMKLATFVAANPDTNMLGK
jgi:hypothetical protein